MLNQQNVRDTIRPEAIELESMVNDTRPTLRVSKSDINDLLWQDVMASISKDEIDAAIDSGADIDMDAPYDIDVEVVQ